MGDKITIGGFSRLPRELSDRGACEIFCEVDSKTGKVVQAECRLPSPLISRALVEPLVTGVKLTDPKDIARVNHELETRLVHRAKKAVMAAFADLVREYSDLKSGRTREAAPDLASDDLDERARRIAQKMPPGENRYRPMA